MIDALLAAVSAHPTFADDPSADVVDGVRTRQSNKFLIIGDTDEEPSADGVQQFADIGAKTRSEDYAIKCKAFYGTGGTQKEARDGAFGFVAAVEEVLYTDPTVGGLARLVAQVENVTLTQTPASAAKSGRSATITFTVHVQNRLIN